MITLTTACHTALLDLHTGQGVLIAPEASADLALRSSLFPSLHEADRLAMLAMLDVHGFDLGEDGETWEQVGTTTSGQPVGYLYGREPLVAEPSMAELASSFAELSALAGLVPLRRVG